MLARWLVLGSAIVATFALAASACTKFGTDDPPDAATDAPVIDRAPPGLCVLPPPSADPGACADCMPVERFASSAVEAAIVEASVLYTMTSGLLYATDNIATGALVKISTGLSVPGAILRMGLDARNVYLSTATAIYRVPRTGGAAEAILPASFTAPGTAPVLFGSKFFFQLQSTSVVREPMDVAMGGAQTVKTNQTSGLFASDGDTAYWLGTTSAATPVLLGPFPGLYEQSTADRKVLGLAVKGELAFIAEPAPSGVGSVISRIELEAKGGGARAVLANEPGVVESVHVADGRVYWISRRSLAAGTRVLVSIDFCGGAPRVTSTDLPPLPSNLSFAGDHAYGVSLKAGAVYELKK